MILFGWQRCFFPGNIIRATAAMIYAIYLFKKMWKSVIGAGRTWPHSKSDRRHRAANSRPAGGGGGGGGGAGKVSSGFNFFKGDFGGNSSPPQRGTGAFPRVICTFPSSISMVLDVPLLGARRTCTGKQFTNPCPFHPKVAKTKGNYILLAEKHNSTNFDCFKSPPPSSAPPKFI